MAKKFKKRHGAMARISHKGHRSSGGGSGRAWYLMLVDVLLLAVGVIMIIKPARDKLFSMFNKNSPVS